MARCFSSEPGLCDGANVVRADDPQEDQLSGASSCLAWSAGAVIAIGGVVGLVLLVARDSPSETRQRRVEELLVEARRMERAAQKRQRQLRAQEVARRVMTEELLLRELMRAQHHEPGAHGVSTLLGRYRAEARRAMECAELDAVPSAKGLIAGWPSAHLVLPRTHYWGAERLVRDVSHLVARRVEAVSSGTFDVPSAYRQEQLLLHAAFLMELALLNEGIDSAQVESVSKGIDARVAARRELAALKLKRDRLLAELERRAGS